MKSTLLNWKPRLPSRRSTPTCAPTKKSVPSTKDYHHHGKGSYVKSGLFSNTSDPKDKMEPEIRGATNRPFLGLVVVRTGQKQEQPCSLEICEIELSRLRRATLRHTTVTTRTLKPKRLNLCEQQAFLAQDTCMPKACADADTRVARHSWGLW